MLERRIESVGRAGAPSLRLTFAGVSVELLFAEPVTRMSIPDVILDCCESSAGIASVVCSVDARMLSVADEAFKVRHRIGPVGGTFALGGATGDISRLGSRRYAARAAISAAPDAVGRLLFGLVTAILRLEGGLVLHSTGVQIGEGALLFVGPSGAGKTTASLQVPGCKIFAVDRVAAYPDRHGQWYTSLFPAGSVRLRSRRTERRTLPLRGILRVVQGSRVRIDSLAGPAAIMMLRENVQLGEASVTGEARLMDTLDAMVRAIPVGRIQTVYEYPLIDHLREWLHEPS